MLVVSFNICKIKILESVMSNEFDMDLSPVKKILRKEITRDK